MAENGLKSSKRIDRLSFPRKTQTLKALNFLSNLPWRKNVNNKQNRTQFQSFPTERSTSTVSEVLPVLLKLCASSPL